MKVLESACLKGFVRMATDGWDQGWHERNGGNLSYRMKEEEVAEIKAEFDYSNEWRPIGVSVPGLAGEYFMVTGSGRYFRNAQLDPEDNICIIEISQKADEYRIVWGLRTGGRPTSELPTHLMNHEVKKEATGGKNRVIYHCHATNLIALTFVLPLDNITFTKELWKTMPECAVVFPDGVGVVEWMVPGSTEVAVASAELMKTYDTIVWAHHGLFCSGEDFDLAFGLAHTVEKSAEILVKMISMNYNRQQVMTTENLRALAAAFNLNLPENCL